MVLLKGEPKAQTAARRQAPVRELDLERYRARYGLQAVLLSNLAIAGVAIFGVWRLDGDKSVIIGVLTAAFTAVSTMTTAYLGIKAVSNTAQAMAQSDPSRRDATPPTPPPKNP
ncbi:MULTISPECIES: hypothetical protein [unclassified Streptomyces]|uniref:hypothetical protein n=1 Tax=unclassified Streptomyces TaxID=2593676 RepID=UPI0033BA403D|nr:hypothetical protein OG199_22495 [Streptomyces sp. NBC_01176]